MRRRPYADYEIDKADHEASKKITIPMLAWGRSRRIASAAQRPSNWRNWATECRGIAVASGHV